MNCKSVQTYLSAYLDGELSGRECLDVRDHLNHCAECGAEERQLRTLKQMLRGLPMYTPSEDFENRLVSHVVAKQERRRVGKLNIGFDWRLVSGFAAAAALATLVMLRATEPQAPPSTKGGSNDGVALEISRDQFVAAGNDPLSGSHYAVPISYAKR